MSKRRFSDPLYAEALLVAAEHVQYARARNQTCVDICASVNITARLGIYGTTARLAVLWMSMQPVERWPSMSAKWEGNE